MIWIISILSFLPVVLYFQQSERWRKIWKNTSSLTFDGSLNGPFISVIIAYRNEEKNLPVLLRSLSNQTYRGWELILVDDYSEDNGIENCSALIDNLGVQVKCLTNADRGGKKSALQTGAKHAKGELIVTTDADCTFEDNWLSAIAHYYNENGSDLLIGPVQQIQSESFLSSFQLYEFTALQITGGAAALNNNAIMLNGANLACKKSLYLEADMNDKVASGDDMFLLEWAKKKNLNIHYIKSKDAIVYTPTEPTYGKLIKQKSRWAVKARNYSDATILSTGAVVALTNLLQAVFMVGAFFYPSSALLFLVVFIIRVAADVRIIKEGSKFFSFVPCLRLLFFYQFIYPFYMLLVLSYPLFFKLHWKGRTIKT
ncbi:glycosyltransferase [Carboxylicivirga caseinilyticus]|uniref:glycosyltransferase n=1 Tax=Carboxylicivirga caseinilyticus TaxID=3417572 RepID=UPI003D329D87|nr:glycosyltransferase [Marinilabiliaceae bacterium A049]